MEAKSSFNVRSLVPVGAFLLFGLISYALHGVLIALLIGFVTAYLLNPLVNLLEEQGMSRPLGALIVLATLLTLVLAVVFVGVPGLAKEVFEASSRFPAQAEALRQKVGGWVSAHFHVEIPASVGDLVSKFGNELRSLAPNPSDIAGAFTKTIGVIAAALGSLIIPIFTYYLLIDFNRIIRYLRRLLPRRFAPPIERLAIEIDLVLSRYVRGQATKSLVLSILYAAGLNLVGVPMGIPIGILIGMLTFVPYVGVAVGSLLVIAMTLLDWQSMNHFWAVLAVLVLIGLLNSQFLTPRIVGEKAPLKSLEVLLAMIGSAALFGVVGLLFAVPLGAVIKILLRRIVYVYANSDFYKHVPEQAAPKPAGSTDVQAPAQAAAGAVKDDKPAPARSIFSRFSSALGMTTKKPDEGDSDTL